MTPEEHQLLVETKRLAEHNAEVLHSIQRSQRVSTVLKVIYWLVIILISVGAIYFASPYVTQLRTTLNTLTGGATP